MNSNRELVLQCRQVVTDADRQEVKAWLNRDVKAQVEEVFGDLSRRPMGKTGAEQRLVVAGVQDLVACKRDHLKHAELVLWAKRVCSLLLLTCDPDDGDAIPDATLRSLYHFTAESLEIVKVAPEALLYLDEAPPENTKRREPEEPTRPVSLDEAARKKWLPHITQAKKNGRRALLRAINDGEIAAKQRSPNKWYFCMKDIDKHAGEDALRDADPQEPTRQKAN